MLGNYTQRSCATGLLSWRISKAAHNDRNRKIKNMGNSIASDFRAAHPEEFGEDGVLKVCIGGGAGFIGSHIAKKLKEHVSRSYFSIFLVT